MRDQCDGAFGQTPRATALRAAQRPGADSLAVWIAYIKTPAQNFSSKPLHGELRHQLSTWHDGISAAYIFAVMQAYWSMLAARVTPSKS